jgi:hypothetical protein
MNTIEDRIRAAASAAASTVTPDSVPPLRLPAGPSRAAGRRRWPLSGSPWLLRIAPVAAAVAVVGIVLAALTVGRSVPDAATSGAMTAGPSISSYLASGQVPPYYVAITSNGNPRFHPSSAVVRLTATGGLVARIAVPTDRTVVAVSAAADDRTFVLDEQLWPQVEQNASAPHAFFLLRLSPAGQVENLSSVPVTIPSGGFVTGLALSPDGSKLALAIEAAHDQATVRVDTLRTGAVRTWSGTGTIGYTFGSLNTGNEAGSLSWTADQQTLAFDWLGAGPGQDQGVWLLNLTRSGRDLPTDSRQAMSGGYPSQSLNQALGVAGTSLTCQGFMMLTPDGSTVICSTAADLGGTARTGFVEYSAATGKISRVIGHWTIGHGGSIAVAALWSNPSGSVLIGAIPVAGGVRVGVIRGNEFTPLGQSALASFEPGTW